MTSYYVERNECIVSFETDPSEDINADAKMWMPDTGEWHDVPGSTGIGAEVKWGSDYYPIEEDWVESVQARQRAVWAERQASR